jgi:hypothetical protein
MKRLAIRDISRSDTLDSLIGIFVLADTADCDTQAAMEEGVFNEDICRISLETDTVIAIVDFPIAKGNVGTVDCICAVGVAG